MRYTAPRSFVTGLSLALTALVNLVASAAGPEPSPPEKMPPGTGAIQHGPAFQGQRALSPDSRLWQRLASRNLDPIVSLPETLLDRQIDAWRALPVGERVARWARLFAGRDDNTYCFGLKPGGYVADSLLVSDHKQDCVSLFYRCTELARARTAREALYLALVTRFAGADPARVVRPTGAVDYRDPSHLDYSLDIVRSGHWGRDVTREVGEAVVDTAGSSRFAPGSFVYIPTERLRLDRLHDGDLVFFVLDERTEYGRKMRRDIGIVIGHQGIATVESDTVYTIHAAAKPLPGVYAGNRVVRVPLLTYLRRVDHFKGIIVTRLEDEAPPPRLR